MQASIGSFWSFIVIKVILAFKTHLYYVKGSVTEHMEHSLDQLLLISSWDFKQRIS